MIDVIQAGSVVVVAMPDCCNETVLIQAKKDLQEAFGQGIKVVVIPNEIELVAMRPE